MSQMNSAHMDLDDGRVIAGRAHLVDEQCARASGRLLRDTWERPRDEGSCPWTISKGHSDAASTGERDIVSIAAEG